MRWSSSSCPAGFKSQLCSPSWMRRGTVTMTTLVTPPRSLGMLWTLLSRAYVAKSKRSVRFHVKPLYVWFWQITNSRLCQRLTAVPPSGTNMNGDQIYLVIHLFSLVVYFYHDTDFCSSTHFFQTFKFCLSV